MSGREPVTCAVIATATHAAMGAGPAAAATKAPKKAMLTAIGGMEFKGNRHVTDTMRFNKDHPWMQGRIAVR